MDANLDCIYCIIRKADSLFSRYETDPDKKLKFMQEVFKIVSRAGKGDTAPYLMAQIMRVFNCELNLGDIYRDLKKEYNRLLISMEPEILSRICAADDQFLTALKYAMTGNYVDFGAMDNVDVEELKRLIAEAPGQPVDAAQYEAFRRELGNAARLVYLIDNAGEIVFDKVFIKIIQETYPDLNIDVVVRGKPILNDATIVEAREVGLCDLVNVVDNGTDIPGTQLDQISAAAKALIDNADLVIAKGQGNFETLFGCGRNIYYLFLCKCDLFTKRFHLERLKGVFINERNVCDAMREVLPTG